MILLDTCVISETIRPIPAPSLLRWLDSLEEKSVFLPALVLGELHRGLGRMPQSKTRSALALWMEQLEARFSGQVLAWDAPTARVWGSLGLPGSLMECTRLLKPVCRGPKREKERDGTPSSPGTMIQNCLAM